MDLSQTAIVPLITSVPYKKQRAMTTRKPKAVQSRERIINDEAHEYLSALASSLAKNEMDDINRQSKERFVWGNMMMLTDKTDNKEKAETITMWYHPSPSEYHKWLTVKKSLLLPRSGRSAGNGSFAERDFKVDDVISIYLGRPISDGESEEYAIDYNKKRLTTGGGFPANRTMYLGAHMVNDYNWCVADTAKNKSFYNVTFGTNLDVIVMKDIKAGEELYVDYNYVDDKKSL